MKKKCLWFVCFCFFASSTIAATKEEIATKVMEQYGELIEAVNWEFGVPGSPMIFCALILTESGGDPNARSKSGAMGLMQVKPVALAQVRKVFPKMHFTDDLYDPVNNIKVGIAYYAYLRYYYKGEGISSYSPIILLAYHKGPEGARKFGFHKANESIYVRTWREWLKHVPFLK